LLPNLLPQKIRLPLISFFSGVRYILGSASKNQIAPDFFFLWSQLHLGKLHLGKLHKERAVIGIIFQALPGQTDRQTDTTVALIYKIVRTNLHQVVINR